MSHRDQHRFFKGAVAGMIGGLVASWAMNQFQAGVSKIEQAWENSAHRAPQPGSNGSGDEPATAKMARRIACPILGRDLTDAEMNIAEPLVHYGFGTFAGGFYGVLAECTPIATKGTGSAYATALWLGADEIAVAKLGLSKSPTEYPASVHAQALAAHLVYGLATEGVRRGVRALL
jgi:putative membrane protein